MMPKHSVYGQWPASGEIDIMELRGNRNLFADGIYNVGVEQVGSTIVRQAWAYAKIFLEFFSLPKAFWSERVRQEPMAIRPLFKKSTAAELGCWFPYLPTCLDSQPNSIPCWRNHHWNSWRRFRFLEPRQLPVIWIAKSMERRLRYGPVWHRIFLDVEQRGRRHYLLWW